MDKSKLIEGLKKIKEAFQTAQKFIDAKLNDGVTIIRYDAEKLDIGVAVMAVTEQGAIAIPDGDYTLEDGTMFTIAGGVVSVVTQGEVEEKPEAASAAPVAQPMTEAKAKSIIESVIKESRFITEDFLTEKLTELNSQKESFATQKNESDKKVTDLEIEIATQNGIIKQMFVLIEQIAGEPSAIATEPIKQAFNVKEFKKAYQEDLQNINKKIN